MDLVKKLSRLWNSPWLEKTQSAAEFYWSLKTRFYYRHFFGHLGRSSKLIQPMRLRNVHNIRIGNNVLINKLSFLLTLQADKSMTPHLSIGDGSIIGHMNHITCINEVQIGKRVLTADRVYISDHSHSFADSDVAILEQGAVSKGKVSV